MTLFGNRSRFIGYCFRILTGVLCAGIGISPLTKRGLPVDHHDFVGRMY
ncbi:8866_t:CDS:2 [Ambispora gerdemannii]|uniref:8866_t:CDS:1 n=1 Tax=Ambispora gerdemannii TaxID=144530 RepID=A0A9N8VEZ5_9GLOM|nr:8866_t:CDS:2 [Ambispora gerdemannii]